MSKDLTWYDGPDGEYVAARKDGLIVGGDDHSTWVMQGVELNDDFIVVDIDEIDPSYSARIMSRIELIDRLAALR